MDNPDQLRDEILKDVDAADSVDALEDIRVSVLGKKGRITDMMKGLGQMDPDARKAAGQALNALKDEIAGALETKKTQLADADLDRRLMTEKIDVTLPPAPEVQGTIHPISQTIDEITEIFGEMGFTVAEGPDIEDDWHNFTALNIPADHPARQEHDTFYLPGEHGAEDGGRDDRRRLGVRVEYVVGVLERGWDEDAIERLEDHDAPHGQREAGEGAAQRIGRQGEGRGRREPAAEAAARRERAQPRVLELLRAPHLADRLVLLA